MGLRRQRVSDPVAAERRAVWWARASMAMSLLLVVLGAWVPVQAAVMPVAPAGVAVGWLMRAGRLRRRPTTVVTDPTPIELESKQ